MPKVVLRDVVVVVDGLDVSDHCTEVTVDDAAAGVDSTAFGSVYTQEVKGMRTAQITGQFQQDFASGSVDDKFSTLNDQEEPFEVTVTPKSGVISASNPKYKIAEAQLMGYQPLSGSVGTLATTPITFSNAGDAGVERITTP